MGIKLSPSKNPLSLTHQKSVIFFKNRHSTIEKISIGKYKSFMCSQVDSLTPEKGAIKIECPEIS